MAPATSAPTTAPARTASLTYPQATAVAVLGGVVLVGRLFLEGRHQVWSDVVAVAVFAVVALVVGFGLVVPRALRTSPATASWSAVALAVLAVIGGVLFFFAPVGFVLGWATCYLARTPLARAAHARRTRVAEVVGIVMIVLNLAYSVYGVVHGWGPGLPR